MIVRRSVAAVLALFASAAGLDAASLFDPVLRFRQLTTEHFVIYYHQGEERLANRLAAIAEETRGRLAGYLPVPATRTHVVLADQSELANGWATPLPYNTIVLNAAWPAGADLNAHTDDWLRVVFSHEFTHIAHLDRSRDWAHAARRVFGRLPLAFPNTFLPVWEIEGIATLFESRLTGGGRQHSSNFAAIVREAARHGRLEPMDRLNGGLTDWPSGQGPYAYGTGFHAYLVRRFGEERLASLTEASARTIPYAGSFAFGDAFGVPLSTLWRNYQDELRSLDASDEDGPADNRDEDQRAIRLTTHGFGTAGPRFLAPACAGCPTEVAYSTVTPHEFPSIQVINVDSGVSRFMTSRYLGSGLAVTGRWLVFDQLDVHRNTGLYSDLYAVNLTSGRVSRLTSEARLLDPDVSADGRSIVALRQERGRRTLVTLRLSDPGVNETLSVDHEETLIDVPETQFNTPRWSPDGSTIAAGRHRAGLLPEVVLVDPADGATRVLASASDHRVVTPTWRPDGQAIVASADFDGTFNLYEFPIDGGPPRRLTSLHGGATAPDISTDGTSITFIGYTPDGFDVFTTPYPIDAPLAGLPTSATTSRRMANTAGGSARSTPPIEPIDSIDRPYTPWSTLRPTYWAPIVTLSGDQLRAGGLTNGTDVLRYHAFAASLTWLLDVAGRDPSPSPSRADWNLSYAYKRWQPTFYVSMSRETTLVQGSRDALGTRNVGSFREDALEGGVVLPTRTIRTSRQWLFAVRREAVHFALDGETLRGTDHAFRAGWAIRTARDYGYSISPEDGGALGFTFDWRPDVAGSKITTLGVDGRAYLPGASRHHVTALRAAFGASLGPAALRREFLVGGTRAAASVMDFDRDALGLLRGFAHNRHASSRLMVFNADYRWPIGSPQRGIRTVPVMVHTVHAAAFLDFAHAWNANDSGDAAYRSIGGELSLDVVAGYHYPFTLTVGAAWTRDRAAPLEDGGTVFARIGRSF